MTEFLLARRGGREFSNVTLCILIYLVTSLSKPLVFVWPGFGSYEGLQSIDKVVGRFPLVQLAQMTIKWGCSEQLPAEGMLETFGFIIFRVADTVTKLGEDADMLQRGSEGLEM